MRPGGVEPFGPKNVPCLFPSLTLPLLREEEEVLHGPRLQGRKHHGPEAHRPGQSSAREGLRCAIYHPSIDVPACLDLFPQGRDSNHFGSAVDGAVESGIWQSDIVSGTTVLCQIVWTCPHRRPAWFWGVKDLPCVVGAALIFLFSCAELRWLLGRSLER